jgi:predicted ATP-grasp superfamily ATP-dependent carboligase
VRILVHEHISGGGMTGKPLPPALAWEGDMMVRALVADLAEIPGADPVVSRDARFPPLPGVELVTAEPGESPPEFFARGAAAADAVWPTAPESDRALEQLANTTLALGRILLGCRPDAVRLTASKRATAGALRAAEVPVVPTFSRSDSLTPLPGPWVVKPDDGAGCEGLRLVDDWRAARNRLLAEPGALVAQPWVEGEAMSLSLLCADGRARLLSCNRQHLWLAGGAPTLTGLTVNAVVDDGRFAALGRRIAAAIPGLWGPVGVDLVRTAAGPVVLEINPRLTTSCCGLRAALSINLAAEVLALLRPDPAWHEATLGPGHPVELNLEPPNES